jgi:hypothetical protein
MARFMEYIDHAGLKGLGGCLQNAVWRLEGHSEALA